MGIITEISAQKRNKSRANVYVDGEFVVALETVTLLERGLKKGEEIDLDKLKSVAEESNKEGAFRRGINYLSKRYRTVKELSDYLEGKGYSELSVNHAINKLTEYGYLGDEELVQSHVGVYGERRGKKRIRQDLLRRGVDRELVESAIGELGDQRDVALAQAEKYLKSREFDSRKLSAHLMSKGFEWEDINYVIRALGGKEE